MASPQFALSILVLYESGATGTTMAGHNRSTPIGLPPRLAFTAGWRAWEAPIMLDMFYHYYEPMPVAAPSRRDYP